MNRILVDHAWKKETDPVLRQKYTSFLKASHSDKKNKHTFFERQALDVIIKEGIKKGISPKKSPEKEVLFPIPERNESKFSATSSQPVKKVIIIP